MIVVKGTKAIMTGQAMFWLIENEKIKFYNQPGSLTWMIFDSETEAIHAFIKINEAYQQNKRVVTL